MHPPKPPGGAAHAAGLPQSTSVNPRFSTFSVFFACQKSAVFSHALWHRFFAILGGFWCRNPPKMEPKVVRKRVLERTRCCSTFLHDFCMFFALFSINFLHAFLRRLLAFFPDFLHFLKTAEVHFGVTSSRILRSCRVSARERFSMRFAKIRENL